MKNGCCILAGGGSQKQSTEIDAKYFGLHENNARILYIPVALERGAIGMEGCYDWFSALIALHAAEKEIDFSLLTLTDDIPSLDAFTSVYLGGGNTYRLLQYLLEKNGLKKIGEFVQAGGIVYGGSAGAIVLGKDVRTAAKENTHHFPSSDGLNLLAGRSVVPHYAPALDAEIMRISKKIDSNILALPEESGLVLDAAGRVTDVVGVAYLFDQQGKRICDSSF